LQRRVQRALVDMGRTIFGGRGVSLIFQRGPISTFQDRSNRHGRYQRRCQGNSLNEGRASPCPRKARPRVSDRGEGDFAGCSNSHFPSHDLSSSPAAHCVEPSKSPLAAVIWFGVPDLTRSVDIKLNERVSLRRHLEALLMANEKAAVISSKTQRSHRSSFQKACGHSLPGIRGCPAAARRGQAGCRCWTEIRAKSRSIVNPRGSLLMRPRH
jgi:hypothetical protein